MWKQSKRHCIMKHFPTSIHKTWLQGSFSNCYNSWVSREKRILPLKVLGKSVGLCKTTKRKDQLYISLLGSVWRIICENFNPNGLIKKFSWDMNENINKENGDWKEFWFWRSVTVHALTPIIIDNFLQWLYFFQNFCNILVSVTPSDNYFTISPQNLALLHSTLLQGTLTQYLKIKFLLEMGTEKIVFEMWTAQQAHLHQV